MNRKFICLLFFKKKLFIDIYIYIYIVSYFLNFFAILSQAITDKVIISFVLQFWDDELSGMWYEMKGMPTFTIMLSKVKI